ncbi:MAG: hypothetical protein K2M16_01755, partial [Muribaculaceae bacterium]|nr:hypothetical protein [Muribaculaceae bacterium]
MDIGSGSNPSVITTWVRKAPKETFHNMDNNNQSLRYDETDLKEAVRVMKEGGIILYPTDTVWG